MKSPALSNPTYFSQNVLTAPQSKGNMGKSLLAEIVSAWLDSHAILWSGSDIDDRHRTFVGRHPEEVKGYEMGNAQEATAVFLTVFRGVLRSRVPVHIIDTRAQADALFMQALEQLNLFDLCRAEGVRMTFFLFPTDDLESLQNLRTLVRFGARQVNYIVAQNPTRGTSRLFQGSPIEAALKEMGAKTIHLPSISAPTMLSMERAESKAGRGISFAEFASPCTGHIEPIMVGEMQWVLGRMFAQLDSVADLLVPPELATKIQQASNAENLSKGESRDGNEDFGFNLGD